MVLSAPFGDPAIRRPSSRSARAEIPRPAPNRKISVKADSAVCRVSDVDVTARSCELVFGAAKRSFKGQLANEVFATLAAAGVASEGAAGSIIESVKKLVCTLDPKEIKQKAGGGAD